MECHGHRQHLMDCCLGSSLLLFLLLCVTSLQVCQALGSWSPSTTDVEQGSLSDPLKEQVSALVYWLCVACLVHVKKMDGQMHIHFSRQFLNNMRQNYKNRKLQKSRIVINVILLQLYHAVMLPCYWGCPAVSGNLVSVGQHLTTAEGAQCNPPLGTSDSSTHCVGYMYIYNLLIQSRTKASWRDGGRNSTRHT